MLSIRGKWTVKWPCFGAGGFQFRAFEWMRILVLRQGLWHSSDQPNYSHPCGTPTDGLLFRQFDCKLAQFISLQEGADDLDLDGTVQGAFPLLPVPACSAVAEASWHALL
jgi:hypothetical protein